MTYNHPIDGPPIPPGHTLNYENEVRENFKKITGLVAVADVLLLILLVATVFGFAKLHDDLDKVNRTLTQVGNTVANNPGNPATPTPSPLPKEEKK
jgi:hypothetical protein